MNLLKKVNVIYTNELVNKTDCNANVDQTKWETPSITCLAATAVLNAVENKISSFIDLVKKKKIMMGK